MAATRPAILAALKALLVAQVTAVAGKVYLPWDAIPETAETFLQVEVAGYRFSDALTGYWDHVLTVRIGAVIKGKFNAQTTWDLLDGSLHALHGVETMGGTATRTTLEGGDDHITEAGDRIMWPHIEVNIYYRTLEGHL